MTVLARVRALRNDEYTGENRCTPCTIVNVVIAAVLALAVSTLWLPGGPVIFVVSLVVIYFWGYLVPGTPWFTKTFFPDWLLAHFDKRPTQEADEDVDLERRLAHLHVIEECPDEDDVCLTPAFESGWRDRIEELRDEDPPHSRIAEVLDVEGSELEFEHHENGGVVATVDGRPFAQWASRGAFVADVAAAMEIQERSDGWRSIDVREWGDLFNGLRVFLEQCPACGGEVAMEPEVRESCCRSVDVVVSACQECGERLFEAEQPA